MNFNQKSVNIVLAILSTLLYIYLLLYIFYIYFLSRYAVQFTLMLLPYHNAVNFILMLLFSTLCSSVYAHVPSSLVIQLTSSSCCFLIRQFTPTSCSHPLLSPTILLTTLYSYTLSFSLTVTDQVSHPYKTAQKLYFCIF
jgi:hypothetical protein